MCYVCNCLVWSMDVVQRTITFCLTGVLICVVCLGFSISIIAGIAYGYNYSLAEFLTFTRSDVTVYMRRGQMNDRPDLAQFGGRRSNVESSDTTGNTDYQEGIGGTGDRRPLSETLVKADDTRKYAERLAKFTKSPISIMTNKEEEIAEESVSYYRFTTPPVNKISIQPNPAIQTTVLESGSSSIIMRKFSPVQEITSDLIRKEPEEYFYKVGDIEDRDKLKSKVKINKESEELFSDNDKDDTTRTYVPMRHFENAPDAEDENFTYKPV